jgi:hypothetical protein
MKAFPRRIRSLGKASLNATFAKRAQGINETNPKDRRQAISEQRAHTWVMDTVTWSDRDNDGSKYMVVPSETKRQPHSRFSVFIEKVTSDNKK